MVTGATGAYRIVVKTGSQYPPVVDSGLLQDLVFNVLIELRVRRIAVGRVRIASGPLAHGLNKVYQICIGDRRRGVGAVGSLARDNRAVYRRYRGRLYTGLRGLRRRRERGRVAALHGRGGYARIESGPGPSPDALLAVDV